jgi:hypothetical protein
LNLVAQNKVFEIYEIKDSFNKKLVKKNYYDNKGNLKIEEFFDFKAFGAKGRRNGKIEYKYKNNKLIEIFYSDPSNGDTAKTIMKYRFNFIITRTKDLITESKIKKGLIYGYGTPNGCLVPPEAMDYYKIWAYRLHKKTINKNHRKVKEYVYFESGTNPHNYEFKYDSNNRLIEEQEFSRRTNILDWNRTVVYTDDKVISTRQFFITYWNKIPATEVETNFLDKFGRIIKIERLNMKDVESCIIINKFDENGNLVVEELYDNNNQFIRKHLILYETPN